MATNIIAEMDLWNLLVNNFAGNEYVFLLFALLVVGIVAAKFRFSSFITYLVLIIFGVLMAGFFSSVLILTIYAIGVMITFFLLKIISGKG